MYQVTGNPRLRALHASPDAPPVDIYIDGTPAFTYLVYGEISDYADLIQGSHRLQAFPAGVGAGIEALIDLGVDLQVGMDYTVAAVGRLQDVQATMLLDSTPPPSRTIAKARVLHASPDAPSVNVGISGGPILFKDVAFAQVTPWKEVNAGRVNLDVKASDSGRALLAIPYHTFAGGSLHTLVAMGLLEGTPAFMVMPLVQAVQLRLPEL